MKNKIVQVILGVWLVMLTGCAEMVMKENSYVVEKDKTAVVEEPIVTGHVDDVFISPGQISTEVVLQYYVYQLPYVHVEPEYTYQDTGLTYPINNLSGYTFAYAVWTSSRVNEWWGYWYKWFWRGYYVRYVTQITPNCNSVITDEGYINPVVINEKQNDGTYRYRMWVTSKYKEYLNTQSSEYNYKYKTLCYTFNGATWDQVTTETPYFETFNDNTHTGDKGGIVLTNILKSKKGASDLYIGLYLGKDPLSNKDENWKLYSSYSINDLIHWTRSNGSLFLGLEKSDANFDSVSIGTSSMVYGDDKYMAYYTGTNKKRSAIGYAYSGNGVDGWTKNSTEPVYKGTAGKFDEYGVMDPCIIKEDGIYKMYYVGFDGLNYRLGLAYSKDGIKFQYHNLDKYEPINLTGNPDQDIRYPNIFIDQDNTGKRQLRIFYCTKKTVPGVYTNTSGGISPAGTTNIWVVNMAVSSVTP
jgi:hypothetical protein